MASELANVTWPATTAVTKCAGTGPVVSTKTYREPPKRPRIRWSQTPEMAPKGYTYRGSTQCRQAKACL